MSVLQANNFAIILLCHVYSDQIIPQFYCAAILIVLHSTRLSCLASDIHGPFNSVTFFWFLVSLDLTPKLAQSHEVSRRLLKLAAAAGQDVWILEFLAVVNSSKEKTRKHITLCIIIP